VEVDSLAKLHRKRYKNDSLNETLFQFPSDQF